jgi:O-antigen/teichoic acid export membrane protein
LAYTILRVEDRLVEYSLFNLLATLLQVICIYFLLAYAKEGYLSKIYGLFISNAILVIVLFERVMKGKLPLSFGFKDLKELLFFYTPISMTNILGWGRSSLDKVAVKVILGDEMLGLYSFMIQISQIFKMGMESFLKSLNVIVYKSTSTLNLLKEKKYLYIAILQLFSIGYYFLALAVDSLGYFGEYTVVGGMFLIIMLSRTILLSTYIESLIFYERKSSLYVMKSNLYSVMVLVSTMLPLIYMLQLYGAVISVLIAALLNFSLLYSKNSLDLENKSTVVKTLTYILFPWFLIGVIQYA